MLISPLPPLCVLETIFLFSFFISPLLYPVRAGERDDDVDDNGYDVEEEENNEDLDEH